MGDIRALTLADDIKVSSVTLINGASTHSVDRNAISLRLRATIAFNILSATGGTTYPVSANTDCELPCMNIATLNVSAAASGTLKVLEFTSERHYRADPPAAATTTTTAAATTTTTAAATTTTTAAATTTTTTAAATTTTTAAATTTTTAAATTTTTTAAATTTTTAAATTTTTA